MQTLTTTPTMDVAQLSLAELQSLQAEVGKAIGRQQDERQRAALDSIAQLVHDAELSPELVMKRLTGKTRRTGGKLPPKYRDLENPENAWAGRGKQPTWLKAKLDAGAHLEDFRIRKSEGGPTRVAGTITERSHETSGQ